MFLLPWLLARISAWSTGASIYFFPLQCMYFKEMRVYSGVKHEWQLLIENIPTLKALRAWTVSFSFQLKAPFPNWVVLRYMVKVTFNQPCGEANTYQVKMCWGILLERWLEVGSRVSVWWCPGWLCALLPSQVQQWLASTEWLGRTWPPWKPWCGVWGRLYWHLSSPFQGSSQHFEFWGNVFLTKEMGVQIPGSAVLTSWNEVVQAGIQQVKT